MERRITLTDEDIGIVVNSLEETRDNAITALRKFKDESAITEQNAFIDKVGIILEDFRDRLDED